MKQLFYALTFITLFIALPACSKKDAINPSTSTAPKLVGLWSGNYTLTTLLMTTTRGYIITSTINGNILLEVKEDNQTSSISFSNDTAIYIGTIKIKDNRLTGKYHNTDSVRFIILENVIINTSDSNMSGGLKSNVNGGFGQFSLKRR